MARLDSYNSTVAARTRAARQIRDTPDLLALYEAEGGLRKDLDVIVAHGDDAALLDQAQSGAQADGSSATAKVLQDFAAIQTEYKSVMRVLRAVAADLEDDGAPEALLQAVARILLDETQILFKPGETESEPGGAKARKKAVRSESQEAVRAEIEKDAAAVVALKPVHKPLAARKVDLKRIQKLHADARALSGKLAERAVKKGAGKAATKSVREAVAAQSKKWGACYGILAAAGHKDTRVRQLLTEAARKR